MEALKAQLAREMKEAEFAKDFAQRQIEEWTEKRRISYRRMYQIKDQLKTIEQQSNG